MNDIDVLLEAHKEASREAEVAYDNGTKVLFIHSIGAHVVAFLRLLNVEDEEQIHIVVIDKSGPHDYGGFGEVYKGHYMIRTSSPEHKFRMVGEVVAKRNRSSSSSGEEVGSFNFTPAEILTRGLRYAVYESA